VKLLTKKIPTLLGLLLLGVVLGGIGWIFSRQQKITENTEIVPTRVRITNQAENKFSVSWITTKETVGWVEYGTASNEMKQIAMDDRDSGTVKNEYLTHHVTIAQLQPETEYFFRIISGKEKTIFENEGLPYAVTTGPIIATTPKAETFYGTVTAPAGEVVVGSLVYVTLPEAEMASTLVKDDGSYTITLSTIRASGGETYAEYDYSASVASLLIDNGKLQSEASVSLVNAMPVPLITLGENADFRGQGNEPSLAQENTATEAAVLVVDPYEDYEYEEYEEEEELELPPTLTPTPSPSSRAVTQTTATAAIVNPAVEGEVIFTNQPEFRGTGTKGLTLSIAVNSARSYSDTIVVENDGTWSWSPPGELAEGNHKITVSYISAGVSKTVQRNFVIATNSGTGGGLQPAFVASGAASIKPSPREVMPATASGVPTTGVITPTLLTVSLGFVMMALGVLLVVF